MAEASPNLPVPQGCVAALGGRLDLPGFTAELGAAIKRAADRQLAELERLRAIQDAVRAEVAILRRRLPPGEPA